MGGFVPSCVHLRMTSKTQPVQTNLLHEGLARKEVAMRPKLLVEGHQYVLDGIGGSGGEIYLDFKLLEA